MMSSVKNISECVLTDVGMEEIEQETTELEDVVREPYNPSDIVLSTPPMNMGDVIDRLQYRWIDMETDYQRNDNLWSNTQQSRLIESILLGLRLPAFYFEEVNKNCWKIIDGLQRCCAIYNFCVKKSLKLQNLEFLPQYNGRGYDDFSFDVRRDIRMASVTVNLLQAGVPEKAKYILFKRLNTGGVPLNPQEIRNAVYFGEAMDVVKELASLPSFKTATLSKIPTKRMQDLDFVSRFLAFYFFDYSNYIPDLNNFINSSMDYIKENYSLKLLDECARNFDAALKLAKDMFGNDAFRKRTDVNAPRGPLNKAYFEVITSAFAKLPEGQRVELLKKGDLFRSNCIRCMKESKMYNTSFSGGTAREESVWCRHFYFEQIILYTLNNQQILFYDDNKIQPFEF